MASETCWTVIRDAAAGDRAARSLFARRYESAVRAYLGARWSGPPLAQDVDDAVQDVFIECFKEGGALARHDADRTGSFRPFLYGLVRNVARRRESKHAASVRRRAEAIEPDAIPSADASLSVVFDRAWARGVMREAAERLRTGSEAAGEPSRRRVELLRLRFAAGLPIREIARRWQVDPARLHHDYARARREFLTALREVVAFHHPGSAGEIDAECADLLALLA